MDRSWSDNLNKANTWTKQEMHTTLYKDGKKTTFAIRQNDEWKNKINVKITYLNKREREKLVRGVILGQNLNLKRRNEGIGDDSQEKVYYLFLNILINI